jgi:hypothetical protein
MAVVLVIFGISAMAGAGYMYLNPPVEEIPHAETNVEQFSTSVDSFAEVTGETELYPSDAVLQNKPVYFTNISSHLTISAFSQVPENQSVAVDHRLILYQEGARDGQQFWENQTVLIGEETTVSDGTYRTNATFNVTELVERRSEIRTEIGGIGTLDSELRLQMSYDSDTYTGDLSTSVPLELSSSAFWLDGNLSASETRSQTGEGETRQLPVDLPVVLGLGLFGLLSVGGGVGLARWSAKDVNLYDLEMEVYRSQYDEWISEGEFPTGSDKQYVYINSIEDLVDVAIDSGKRVIYDPDLETYNVVDDDLIYYHAEDPRRIESWLNFAPDEGN